MYTHAYQYMRKCRSQLLHQADPGIDVLVQATGELVLVAAGEMHIERCERDLKEIFCPGIEFTISKPIIPLRETISEVSAMDMRNELIGDSNVRVVNATHFLLDGRPDDIYDVTDPVSTSGPSGKDDGSSHNHTNPEGKVDPGDRDGDGNTDGAARAAQPLGMVTWVMGFAERDICLLITFVQHPF